jgi:hypothetical protein
MRRHAAYLFQISTLHKSLAAGDVEKFLRTDLRFPQITFRKRGPQSTDLLFKRGYLWLIDLGCLKHLTSASYLIPTHLLEVVVAFWAGMNNLGAEGDFIATTLWSDDPHLPQHANLAHRELREQVLDMAMDVRKLAETDTRVSTDRFDRHHRRCEEMQARVGMWEDTFEIEFPGVDEQLQLQQAIVGRRQRASGALTRRETHGLW